jgi:hypothetical protein
MPLLKDRWRAIQSSEPSSSCGARASVELAVYGAGSDSVRTLLLCEMLGVAGSIKAPCWSRELIREDHVRRVARCRPG